ncbi:hypothetical protein [Corynebacterium cystitidis]|uniref:hypothetical protein n=1 Tax=Corynebacterium cystitidis TaxID=35757 RepID=UPI00358DB288
MQQHGITAREYKRKHGLKQSTGLVSHAISKSYSEKSQANIGSDTWEKFVEARDPEAAQAARTDESFSHQRRKIGRSEQASRQNIRGHHKPRRPRRCPICGRQIEKQGWSTCGDKRCKAIKAFRQPTELGKAIDKHWESGITGDSEIARLVGCTPQNVRYRRKIRERAKTILTDLESELGPLP